MKHLINLLVICMLAFVTLQAQTFDNPSVSNQDGYLYVDFGTTSTGLDSAAADTSGIFTLEDADGGIGNFATLYSNLTSGGTPKTDISIYGCETYNGTYVILDAVQDAEADTGPVYTAFDLAGARAKFYKIIITNEATGAALTAFQLGIHCHKKDF